VLQEVMDFYGLEREFRNTGFFETDGWRRLYQELKGSIVAGHLVALTGVVGSGKTVTARRIRTELGKENHILVSAALAVERDQVKLSTLITALFADLSTEKDFKIPTKPEVRERELRDLIRRRRKPVALFVDEAHDLHSKTLVGLKRLMEVVREAEATMAIVLIGHRSLVVGLRRAAMEEIGARSTVLELPGIRGQEREFLNWMLQQCTAKDVEPQEIFTEEAMKVLAERLSTPLQMIHYAWRALEAGHLTGQKPVDRDTVEDVLAPDLNALEPSLARLGYNPKILGETLDAKPAEIRAFLRGHLAPGRSQELQSQMLKLGIIAS